MTKEAATTTPTVPVTPAVTPTAPVAPAAAELRIDELKLCSNIDANWNCAESNTFNVGDKIYVYVKLSGMKQSAGKVYLEEVLIFRDQKNAILHSLTTFEDITNYYDQQISTIKINKMRQSIASDPPGIYNYDISVTDMFTNKTVERKGSVTLK
jgi:hypothetical protein